MKNIDKITDFFYGIELNENTTLQDILYALEDGEFLATCFSDENEKEHIRTVEEIYGCVEDLINHYGKDYLWYQLKR